MTPDKASPAKPRLSERAHVQLQRLLPHHVLGWLMRTLTRCRVRWWKNWQIGWFIRRYGVDIDEIDSADPDDYRCFNAFFTRALKPGVRTLATDPDTIVSPVDGSVSQAGVITGTQLFQAKGRYYELARLLGGGEQRIAPFRDGRFATFYLAPRDYHRIHMPLGGRLRRCVHIPGRLFSVDPKTTRGVQGLFARNERLVTFWDSEAGPMALVIVGALFVGSIETVWGYKTGRPVDAPSVTLERGAELGRFNMGSTVIALFDSSVTWAAELAAETHVRMGQQIGRFQNTLRD